MGGTKCLGVVVDARWRVQRSARRPTRRKFDDLVAVLREIVDEIAPPTERATRSVPVGVGLPGLIDRRGNMHAAPHLDDPVDGPVPARELLEAQLGRAVMVDNDATCHTIAEWQLGAARDVDDFVMVTLGSGIGGGVVMDGRVQRGAHGFAGEFGHMMVHPDGLRCPCGRRGCWERYASGQGLRALARVAFDAGRLESLRPTSGEAPDGVTAEMVHDAARDGDRDAISVLDEFADWIAVGLSSLTNAYDPAAFVLGGGLAGTEDVLGDSIRRHLAGRLYSSIRRPLPEVRFAALGPAAGAIGAALMTSADLAAGQ